MSTPKYIEVCTLSPINRRRSSIRSVEVAKYVGPVAIHQTIGDPTCLTLTHVSTGYAIDRYLPSISAATTLAESLIDQFDWSSKRVSTYLRWPIQQKKAVRELINAASLRKKG